jgi:hypothetical protein
MNDIHPGLGHNLPPADADLADLRERLAHDHKALIDNLRDSERGTRNAAAEINDEETAQRVTEFIGQAQARMAKAKEAHDREKRPFLGPSRIIDRFFNDPVRDLTLALSPVVTRLARYRRAVEDELRRQGKSDRVKIRGDYDSTAYNKVRWRWRVVDISAVPMGWQSPDAKLIDAELHEALDRARAAGREDPEIAIPGIEFYRDDKLIVRAGGVR